MTIPNITEAYRLGQLVSPEILQMINVLNIKNTDAIYVNNAKLILNSFKFLYVNYLGSNSKRYNGSC